MGVTHLGQVKDCLRPSGRYISPVPQFKRALDRVWSQATARLVNGIHVSRLVERQIETRDLDVIESDLRAGRLSVDGTDSLPLRALLDIAIDEWRDRPQRRVDIQLSSHA